ncbi:hypothetical protein GCM10023221_35710 [Luteimicrobium xylanilyticum]|uniref:hypothetical protein n=1 Tax=Luteimicrobium xylanilyticum TaxID=1133546 RepID=UPI0031E8DA07
MTRRSWLRAQHLGSDADRATFETLHTASLMAAAFRDGLTPASAENSVRHLRTLVGAHAVALTDTTNLLAWDGDETHRADAQALAVAGAAHGRTDVVGHGASWSPRSRSTTSSSGPSRCTHPTRRPP